MLALLTLALAMPSPGTALAAPVSVDYSPPTIFIRVATPVPLEVVVAALCEKLEARCDPISPLPSRPMMSPKVISGSWEYVIEELMAELGVGYAAVPPGEGRGAQLIIQGNTSRSGGRSPEPKDDSSATTPMDPPPGPSTEAAEPPEPTAAEEVEPAANTEFAAAEAAGPNAGAFPEPGPPIPRPVVVAPALAAAPSVHLVPTPFAAPDGRPLTLRLPLVGAEASPNWVATPFLDENGGPLTVPFVPDTSPVAPFSDPDGRPIPIQLNPKPPKLEYPIPPTPSPTQEEAGAGPPSDSTPLESGPPTP